MWSMAGRLVSMLDWVNPNRRAPFLLLFNTQSAISTCKLGGHQETAKWANYSLHSLYAVEDEDDNKKEEKTRRIGV